MTVLFGRAVQHADVEILVIRLITVCSMFLTYSLDDSNVCGSRGGEIEGIGSV